MVHYKRYIKNDFVSDVLYHLLLLLAINMLL